MKIKLSKPFAPLTAAARRPLGHGHVAQAAQEARRQVRQRTRSASGRSSSRSAPSRTRSCSSGRRDYYDASKVKLDKLTFKIITESSARASNLRSGDVDVDRPARADRPADDQEGPEAADARGHLARLPGPHGQHRQQERPGEAAGRTSGRRSRRTPKLREAFDAAIDRKGIAKVVFDNGVSPAAARSRRSTRVHDASQTCPPRDLAKAKKLVKESGAKTPVPVTLMLNTDAVTARLGQVIQAMTKEAGFAVKLQPTRVHQRARQGRRGRLRHVPARLVGPRRPRRRHLRVRRQQGLAQRLAATRTRGSTRCSTRRARPTTRPSARTSTSRPWRSSTRTGR